MPPITRALFHWLALVIMACSAQWCRGQSITLAWDGVSGVSGYRLFQSLDGAPFALAASVTTTTATVSAAPGSTRYYVTSWNSAGESVPSNIVTNTIVTPPPTNLPPVTPTGLHANQIQGHRLDIGWTGDLNAGTKVERAVESDPFWEVATVPAGTLHWTDNYINKRRTYRYRVRSFNSFGFSSYSNEMIFGSQ